MPHSGSSVFRVLLKGPASRSWPRIATLSVAATGLLAWNCRWCALRDWGWRSATSSAHICRLPRASASSQAGRRETERSHWGSGRAPEWASWRLQSTSRWECFFRALVRYAMGNYERAFGYGRLGYVGPEKPSRVSRGSELRLRSTENLRECTFPRKPWCSRYRHASGEEGAVCI